MLTTFFFLYEQIVKNNEKAEEVTLAAESEAQKREELRLLDRSLALIRADRARLDTHFSKSSDVVPFLNEIENTGKAVGVRVQVSYVDISQDSTSLRIRVSADGSFKALTTFIHLLEHFPYILEFNSLVIETTAPTQTDAAGALIPLATPLWRATMDIKLITFVK